MQKNIMKYYSSDRKTNKKIIKMKAGEKITTSVANNKTEETLRELLIRDGYKLSTQRKSGEQGTDIIAINYDKVIHIEVIGHKEDHNQRARDFYEVFFRALARLNDGAKKIVIAVPAESWRGIRNRANYIRTAWKRLTNCIPELEIWLVDVENKKYEKTSWIEWVE